MILTALRLLPFLDPAGRYWGVNHLIFLPEYVTYLYILLGLTAIALLFPGPANAADKYFDKFSNLLFASRGKATAAAFFVISIAVFWILRRPTNLLGDGYAYISNIGDEMPVIYTRAEMGAIYIVNLVAGLIPVRGYLRGEYSYAIVSVLSGGATVLILRGIAGALGEDTREKLLYFLLLLLSGWTLLFFGYAENYPVIWPFVTGYVYTGILYLKGRRSIIWPLILLLLSTVIHMQALFFAPSFLILIFGRGGGLKIYRKLKYVWWIAAAVIFLILVYRFSIYIKSDIAFRAHFLPLFHGFPRDPDYYIFSLKHWGEILNLLLLLIPLFPLMLLAANYGALKSLKDKTNNFLMVLGIGGILFLVIIDPRLGLGRDWDLFALTLLAPAIFLIKISIGAIKKYCVGLSLLALVLVAPFLITNLTTEPSLRYVQYLFDLDTAKSKSGRVQLYKYYEDHGLQQKADSVKQEYETRLPEASLAPRIHELTAQRDYARAMNLLDEMFAADPYSAEPYNLRGTIYLRQGKLSAAANDFRTGIELSPYKYEIITNLALVYQRMGRSEAMMKNLRKAYGIAPEYVPTLDGLAMAFTMNRHYDSALFYAERVLQLDSVNTSACLAGGNAALNLGRYDLAREYIEKYKRLVPPDRQNPAADRILRAIENKP